MVVYVLVVFGGLLGSLMLVFGKKLVFLLLVVLLVGVLV